MKKEKTNIVSYIHCQKCLNGKLDTGFTKTGLEIYCPDCKLIIGQFPLDVPKEFLECACCKTGKHKICKN